MSTIEHQLLFLLGLVLLLNFLALRGLWQDIFTELRYQGRLLICKARRAKRCVTDRFRYFLGSVFWMLGKRLFRLGIWFKHLADKIDPLPF